MGVLAAAAAAEGVAGGRGVCGLGPGPGGRRMPMRNPSKLWSVGALSFGDIGDRWVWGGAWGGIVGSSVWGGA